MKIEGLDDEKAEWYYLPYGEEKAKGPVSKRDIDVEWRTHSIYSDTLVYKEGLGGWKKLSEVPELVQLLNIANSEVTEEVLKAREQLKNMGNPLIVASAAGKFAPYQSADGLWHYYDPETKQWKTSKEDPHKTSERKQSEDLRSPLKKPEVAEVGAEVPVELLPPESKEELAKKEEERKKALLKKEKRKRYQQNKKKKWYNPKISASVYVTGLPPDISQEELSEYFSKCGILRVDPHTGEKKVKIYEESDGRRKGDALIQYARGESIELALEHLNESEIRPGYKIHVERARFQQKGEEYQPRKKKKTDKLELYRIKTEIERLFTWSEDEVLQKGLKIVVMKGVFTLEEVSKDPNPEQFFKELEEDIKMECEQKLGEVERIVVYEHNPEGVVQIKFKTPIAAAECVKLMNGRYFGGHKISCFYWDGKTDYRKPPETEEEMKRRVEEFGKWLGDEGKSEEEEEESEEEKKEEEKLVSSAVSDAIQKMLDEKLAQLRRDKLKELEEANKQAQ